MSWRKETTSDQCWWFRRRSRRWSHLNQMVQQIFSQKTQISGFRGPSKTLTCSVRNVPYFGDLRIYKKLERSWGTFETYNWKSYEPQKDIKLSNSPHCISFWDAYNFINGYFTFWEGSISCFDWWTICIQRTCGFETAGIGHVKTILKWTWVMWVTRGHWRSSSLEVKRQIEIVQKHTRSIQKDFLLSWKSKMSKWRHLLSNGT